MPGIEAGVDDMLCDGHRQLLAWHHHRLRSEQSHRLGREPCLHVQFESLDIFHGPHRPVGMNDGAIRTGEADRIDFTKFVLQVDGSEIGESLGTYERTT